MVKPVMQPPLQGREVSGAEPSPTVAATLSWPGGHAAVTNPPGGFGRLTREWTYIVGNRQRWSSVQTAVKDQERDAQAALERCGVGADVLRTIAGARIVEVSLTGDSDSTRVEAARHFPWEFVLAAATRDLRCGMPLTVLRHIPSPHPPLVGIPRSALYIQSAPGPLASLYNFDSERALVRASLPPECVWHEVFDPTLDELTAHVDETQPALIHLAGFDNHQGARLVPTLAADGEVEDGYVLRDNTTGVTGIRAHALARALMACGHRPMLVSCSLWNSGRALGPALLDAGAGAALGFQDTFDDTLAEAFFSAFYEACRANDWNLAPAFVEAWTAIRQAGPPLLGSGVTLWHTSPAFAALPAAPASLPSPAGMAPGVGTGIDVAFGTGVGTVSGRRAKVSRRTGTGISGTGRADVDVAELDPDTMSAQAIIEALQVHVDPMSELNYSLLHNHRPLFSQFKITQLKPGRVRDLSVKVELFCGGHSWPYQAVVEMDTNPLDLRRKVHVALTSSLVRSAREAVNTGLLVEVMWKKHVLWRNTTPVRLLPADQWRDNDADRVWLPSFVLPRDPAVTTLVELAQRYVRVLRDDPTAGFDGYQSVDPEREDPSEEVDLQVQALWSAILHEWRLGYINPPPTYGRGLDSQRLRTPSMVLRQHAGTCIDLSLLFASALELVDIYPVIFLLNGHAFPGYWRTEEAHAEFVRAAGAADSGATSSDTADRTPWLVTSYPEVTRHVNDGNLVPIETVALTAHTGFWEAVEQGRDNLAAKDEFHSLVDTLMARQKQVTPLPIVEAV